MRHHVHFYVRTYFYGCFCWCWSVEFCLHAEGKQHLARYEVFASRYMPGQWHLCICVDRKVFAIPHTRFTWKIDMFSTLFAFNLRRSFHLQYLFWPERKFITIYMAFASLLYFFICFFLCFISVSCSVVATTVFCDMKNNKLEEHTRTQTK